MLSAFFSKAKDMDGFWQVTFSGLYQDIGQEASDTRFGVPFGSNHLDQLVNRPGYLDGILDAYSHFLIDLINST